MSVWGMNKRSAFTLIEMMIAVMIISVVVAALLQLQANNTHLFERIEKKESLQHYTSLLLASKYGFENDSLTLDRLVERFDIDDDLRRELKKIKLKVMYETLETIDLSQMSDEDALEAENPDEEKSSSLSLEIGRSILRFDGESVSIMRVRLP